MNAVLSVRTSTILLLCWPVFFFFSFYEHENINIAHRRRAELLFDFVRSQILSWGLTLDVSNLAQIFASLMHTTLMSNFSWKNERLIPKRRWYIFFLSYWLAWRRNAVTGIGDLAKSDAMPENVGAANLRSIRHICKSALWNMTALKHLQKGFIVDWHAHDLPLPAHSWVLRYFIGSLCSG